MIQDQLQSLYVGLSSSWTAVVNKIVQKRRERVDVKATRWSQRYSDRWLPETITSTAIMTLHSPSLSLPDQPGLDTHLGTLLIKAFPHALKLAHSFGQLRFRCTEKLTSFPLFHGSALDVNLVFLGRQTGTLWFDSHYTKLNFGGDNFMWGAVYHEPLDDQRAMWFIRFKDLQQAYMSKLLPFLMGSIPRLSTPALYSSFFGNSLYDKNVIDIIDSFVG